MPGSPEIKGQFIFCEEDLKNGTTTEKELCPEDRVVLVDGKECKIEIKIRESEATVSIFNPNGSFVCHHWNPPQGTFSRSSRASLNHGVFLDLEKRSLRIEFTEENRKIKRTVLWRQKYA